MKVSEYLLHLQEHNEIPVVDDEMLHFWAGWLVGAMRGCDHTESIKRAIQAAQFIEARAQEKKW